MNCKQVAASLSAFLRANTSIKQAGRYLSHYSHPDQVCFNFSEPNMSPVKDFTLSKARLLLTQAFGHAPKVEITDSESVTWTWRSHLEGETLECCLMAFLEDDLVGFALNVEPV